MSTTSTFITVPEIQEVLTVSESKAYRIVRTLNEELKKNVNHGDKMYKNHAQKMYNHPPINIL